jgi:hypothetical protein
LNSISASWSGDLADFTQEGQPARVAVDFVEQIFRYDFAASRVLVINPLGSQIDEWDGRCFQLDLRFHRLPIPGDLTDLQETALHFWRHYETHEDFFISSL